MNLVATPANPIPRDAMVFTVRASDGMALRMARWEPKSGKSAGTVAVLSGRSEFIEKFFEVINELLARDFTVVAMDWRGQGLSGRELDNSRKGHIDDFSLYQRDLEALSRQVLEPFCPKPWFALGHSMGGAILLEQARAGGSPFERLVLTAPMIDLYALKHPRATRALVETLDIIGLGGAFIPGGGETASMTKRFEGNVLTSDEARYRRSADILAAAPHLGIGDPTIGWLNAAFRLMDQFADPEFPRRTLTPILVIAAGADRVVSTPAGERFATRWKAGRLLVIPGAEHEILVELDAVRQQFWAAFDAFIPGSREELEALLAAHEARVSASGKRAQL
jgi:lysophospholipase